MKHLKIYWLLLGFSIFTGATFPVAKYTVQYFSPASAAAWRFGIAAITMTIILGLTERINLSLIRKNFVPYFILGLVGIFGFNTLFFLGLKYTSPVNGALVMATNPLLTTLLARWILKDVLRTRQWAGILFAFSGVVLVITHGSLEVIQHLSFSKGDVIILAGNICWAFYGVLGRRYIKESTPMATTTYTMIIGAVSLIGASFFTVNPVPLSNIPFAAWSAILFMALCTTVLGYLWWNLGMKEIGASKTSLFFNLVPVITMLLSLITGSVPTLFQTVGAMLVIMGVLTSTGVIRLPSKKAAQVSG